MAITEILTSQMINNLTPILKTCVLVQLPTLGDAFSRCEVFITRRSVKGVCWFGGMLDFYPFMISLFELNPESCPSVLLEDLVLRTEENKIARHECDEWLVAVEARMLNVAQSRSVNKCLDEIIMKPVMQAIAKIEERQMTSEYEGFLRKASTTGSMGVGGDTCLTKGRSGAHKILIGDSSGCEKDGSLVLIISKVLKYNNSFLLTLVGAGQSESHERNQY